MPIVPYYQFYVSTPFCHPVKCVADNRIAGIGAAIEHRGTGWVAHIIVDANLRRQGFGELITRSLMHFLLAQQRVTSLHLVATPMGEPLYRKLGFVYEGEYIFFRGGITPEQTDIAILDWTTGFRQPALNMDFETTSEDRTNLLEPHWANGRFIQEDGKLTGFYLPTLGEGYILATSSSAGIALLRLKHCHGASGVIPEANQCAIEYMEASGYSEYRRGIRMTYGQSLRWHPERIFGRVGGNLG